MVRFHAALLLGLACGLAAVPAGAHEYWLALSRYQAAPGDTVDVRAFAGTGFRGELKPWAAPRAIRFMMRGPRELDLTRTAVNADLVWARFVTADAAGVLLAYESTFAKIELPGPQFEAYLQLEGLDGPLATRRRAGTPLPGRERYARCPKAWVAGSSVGKDAHARALQPPGPARCGCACSTTALPSPARWSRPGASRWTRAGGPGTPARAIRSRSRPTRAAAPTASPPCRSPARASG